MAERFVRHLRPEIQREVLPLARRLPGQAPILKWVEGLPQETHAMLYEKRPSCFNTPAWRYYE